MSVVVGSIQRLTYDIADGTNTPVNPTGATLSIVRPDGTPVTPAPNIVLPPATTGHLIYDYITTQVGRHTALWTSQGPTTTGSTIFNVDPTDTGALFSLSEAKTFLNIPASDTSNDLELRGYIDVATAITESQVGPVVQKTVTERCEGRTQQIALKTGPVIAIVSCTPWLSQAWGETIAVTDLIVNPGTWIVERLSGMPFWRGPYKMVYTVGRPIVPYNILQGAKVILSHIWESQRGPSMVGPGMPDDTEDFSVAGRFYSVPRAALELFGPHSIGPSIR